MARTRVEEAPPLKAQKQKPHEYTVTYVPVKQALRSIYFSRKEIKHLAIGALLVMGAGLSLALYPNVYREANEPIMIVMFTVILTGSFFIHEIAHKIAAQKRGLWAEFRLTLMGAVLTLFSVVSAYFKIISPGAVMIGGFADKEKIGRISIAGPATNIVLSGILLALSLVPVQGAWVFLYGATFNAWIAVFNLIPFGILDGFKIFAWNSKIWALAFAASLAIMFLSFLLQIYL